MNRTILIIILSIAIVAVLGLGGFLVKLIMDRNAPIENAAIEQVQARKPLPIDKYANMNAKAIDIVKNYKVLTPEYVDAYAEAKEKGIANTVEKGSITINELVEQQFLEKRFKMAFLQRGEWRALHLDTDAEAGTEQVADPLYEVYLDYHDESVVVGPVWIVDVAHGVVIPRNDMASVFDRNEYNYEEVNENLKRPASVVRAITSHKFDVGIDLGGVFLLHFLKLTTQPKHTNDEIIGWTVMHEFEDEFSAFFQWKELDEVRVAKFRFNWSNKIVEPKGLLAIDLMAVGDNMEPVASVDIYPKEYSNNLKIPRNERWIRGHSCRSADYRELCTAFVKVLEQQDFMNAMAWLLTNGEPNASRRVEKCKEDKKCGWVPKLAPDDLNPEKRDDLFEVDYKYELNGRSQMIRFLVDDKNDNITPLDKISQWAYYSVTPRT